MVVVAGIQIQGFMWPFQKLASVRLNCLPYGIHIVGNFRGVIKNV